MVQFNFDNNETSIISLLEMEKQSAKTLYLHVFNASTKVLGIDENNEISENITKRRQKFYLREKWTSSGKELTV